MRARAPRERGVAKEETYIGGKNFKDIHDELSRMGARLMADTLPRIESGESEYTPQNSEEATYAPKLTKADGKIDFGGRAGDLNRQIRAFDPWPGAFCDYKNTKLKIWNAEAVMDFSTSGLTTATCWKCAKLPRL